VILDDPVVGGQTESHFHPLVRGAEVEVGDARQLLCRDAPAGGADKDTDLILCLTSADRYMPGFLDRLDRILQQVHEDLVKLARGAVNGLDLAVVPFGGDPISQLTLQQCQHAVQTLVQVDDLKFRFI